MNVVLPNVVWTVLTTVASNAVGRKVQSCHASAPSCRRCSAGPGRCSERKLAAIPRAQCQRHCGARRGASCGVRIIEELALEAGVAARTFLPCGMGRSRLSDGLRSGIEEVGADLCGGQNGGDPLAASGAFRSD